MFTTSIKKLEACGKIFTSENFDKRQMVGAGSKNERNSFNEGRYNPPYRGIKKDATLCYNVASKFRWFILAWLLH